MKRIKQFLVLTFVFFSLSAFAAPGDLDPSFGFGGVVIANYANDSNVAGSDQIIQSSGKIMAVGTHWTDGSGRSIALARFSPVGALDTTFGTNGWTIINFGYPYITANAAAEQPDGKIVVTGPFYDGVDDHFYVARFTPDGLPDMDFGNGGIAVIDFGVFEEAVDIAVQGDGKILIAGSIFDEFGLDVLLVRVDKKGKLDRSFGNRGMVRGEFNGLRDTGHTVTVQPDKKILVAGGTDIGSSNDAIGVMRFTYKGNLDSSFGNGGRVTTDLSPNDDGAVAIEVQPDGKIIVAGLAQPVVGVFAFNRYNQDGSIDLSHLEDHLGSFSEFAGALALGSNGRILLGGHVSPDGSGTTDNSAIACFDGVTGSLDPSFGASGWAIYDFGPDLEGISSVKLQSDNKIVSVGVSLQGDGHYYLVVARYNGCA